MGIDISRYFICFLCVGVNHEGRLANLLFLSASSYSHEQCHRLHCNNSGQQWLVGSSKPRSPAGWQSLCSPRAAGKEQVRGHMSCDFRVAVDPAAGLYTSGALGEAMTSISRQNSWNAPCCSGCGVVAHVPDVSIAWCLSGGTVFCCLLTNVQACSSAVTHQSWPRRENVLLQKCLISELSLMS